jgi:hypothetical protein
VKYRIVKIKANVTGIPREEVRKGFRHFLDLLEDSCEIAVESAGRDAIECAWQVFANKGTISDNEIVGYRLEQDTGRFWDILNYSEPS